MRKAIALLKDKPLIESKFHELEALEKLAESKMDFLKRQADRILEHDIRPERDRIWKGIEDECRLAGLLPADFGGEKYHFHSDDDGVLYVCDGAEHIDPAQLIASLLKS